MLLSNFNANCVVECLFIQYIRELDFHTLCVKGHFQLSPLLFFSVWQYLYHIHNVILNSFWIFLKASIIRSFSEVLSNHSFPCILIPAESVLVSTTCFCLIASTLTVQWFNLNVKYLCLWSRNLILIQVVVENESCNTPCVRQIKKYEHWSNSG